MKLSLKIRLTLQAQPRSGTWGTPVYLDNVWLRARPEREWDAVKERRWLRETRARERDGVTERERDGERERDDVTTRKNQNVKEV